MEKRRRIEKAGNARFDASSIFSPESLLNRRDFVLPKEYASLKLEKIRENNLRAASGLSPAPPYSHPPASGLPAASPSPGLSPLFSPPVIPDRMAANSQDTDHIMCGTSELGSVVCLFRGDFIQLWRLENSWKQITEIALERPKLRIESKPVLLCYSSSVCIKQYLAELHKAQDSAPASVRIHEYSWLIQDNHQDRTGDKFSRRVLFSVLLTPQVPGFEVAVKGVSGSKLPYNELPVVRVFADLVNPQPFENRTSSLGGETAEARSRVNLAVTTGNITSVFVASYRGNSPHVTLARVTALPVSVVEMTSVESGGSLLLRTNNRILVCQTDSGAVTSVQIKYPVCMLRCMVRPGGCYYLVAGTKHYLELHSLTTTGTKLVKRLPLPRTTSFSSRPGGTFHQNPAQVVRFSGSRIRLLTTHQAAEWDLPSARIVRLKRFASFEDFLVKLHTGFQ